MHRCLALQVQRLAGLLGDPFHEWHPCLPLSGKALQGCVQLATSHGSPPKLLCVLSNGCSLLPRCRITSVWSICTTHRHTRQGLPSAEVEPESVLDDQTVGHCAATMLCSALMRVTFAKMAWRAWQVLRDRCTKYTLQGSLAVYFRYMPVTGLLCNDLL